MTAQSQEILNLIANPVTQGADRASCVLASGATNTTHMGKYTITAGSKVNSLPSECYGRYVRLYGSVAFEYFFTTNGSATIAASGASTDAGTRAATQGEPVPATTYHEVKVPWPGTVGTVYLARIGSVGDLHVVLADGTIGVTGQ